MSTLADRMRSKGLFVRPGYGEETRKQELLQKLQQCPIFIANNVVEHIKQECTCEFDELPIAIPTFPVAWFEYWAGNERVGVMASTCSHCRTTVLQLVGVYEKRLWLQQVEFGIKFDVNGKANGRRDVGVDYTLPAEQLEQFLAHENYRKSLNGLLGLIFPTLLVLSVAGTASLPVKDVTAIVGPSEKWLRSHKLPALKYHEIDIAPALRSPTAVPVAAGISGLPSGMKSTCRHGRGPSSN